MEGTDDSRTTNASDGAAGSAVQGQLFDLHPTQVTVAELVREIGGEQADFGERDAIERTIRDLGGAGLLHRNDDFVMATRAALRFSELLDR